MRMRLVVRPPIKHANEAGSLAGADPSGGARLNSGLYEVPEAGPVI